MGLKRVRTRYTYVRGVVDARGLDHDEIALAFSLVLGGFLQATDNSLCHFDQTGLFGRVAVDLIRSASVLNVTFTERFPVYLVAHVRLSEQADIRLGSVHAVSTLEGIEARPVQDDVVALFAGISESIDVVGTGGASGGIGNEEAKATAKLEIYNRSEGGISNELLSNDPLLISVIDMRGKGGGRGVLESGKWWIANKTWVAHGNAGGRNKSCLIASKMSSLENSATGVSIFIDSDSTIIGLKKVANEQYAYKVFQHPL